MLNRASCQPKRLIFILKTQTYKVSYGPGTKKEKQLFLFFFFKLDGTLGGNGYGTLHIEGLQATNWFFFTLIFFFCVCVFCLRVCSCTTCVLVPRGQTTSWDTLELQLQAVVSQHVRAGNRTWIP